MEPILKILVATCIATYFCACGDGILRPINTEADTQTSVPVTTDSAPPLSSDTSTQSTDSVTDTTDLDTSSDTGTDTGSDTGAPYQTIESEAEAFVLNDDKGTNREWVLITVDSDPGVLPDVDPASGHAETASGEAYMEALPDFTAPIAPDTDSDTSIDTDAPTNNNTIWWTSAESPSLSYPIYVEIPGRFYVWVRAWATTGDDNTAYVGIDGTWPQSGQDIQFPAKTNGWVWRSNQRNSDGTTMGEPLTIWLDIDMPGEHTIYFAIREDGFEIDKWLLSSDPEFVPE